MVTKAWFKPVLRTAAFLLALLLAVQLAGYLLLPTSNRYLYGYKAGGIFGEDANTVDVLVMGDSNAAQGIAPMEWYDAYGVTGYTYGVAWLSSYNIYYRLKQVFRQQSPRVVVLCTGPMYARRDESSSYLSSAVREITGELLPLLQFHDQWKTVPESRLSMKKDFTWRDVNKGFFPLSTVAGDAANGQEWVYMNDVDADPAYIPPLMQWYLRRIKRLCDRQNAQLLLVTVPAARGWNFARHKGAARIAEMLDVPYLDYNLREEYPLGLDWRTDTPDGGYHLNVLGAKKLSDALGAYLTEHYDLADHRGAPGYEDWDADAAAYRKDCAGLWETAKAEAAAWLQENGQNA